MNMPVFVRIKEPKELRQSISSLKKLIGETRQTLARINEISRHEESKIDEWQSLFDSITTSISEASQKLSNPETY